MPAPHGAIGAWKKDTKSSGDRDKKGVDKGPGLKGDPLSEEGKSLPVYNDQNGSGTFRSLGALDPGLVL